MIARIVELQSPGSYVRVSRGHLVVLHKNQKLGSVPLADVGVLLVSNPACVLSVSVISRLIANGAQVVICGENFQPTSVLLPINQTVDHGNRIQAQFRASVPQKKRLWSILVHAKIRNQTAALEAFGIDNNEISSLLKKIRSGDPLNIEAQAARLYWPLLFGIYFRRSPILGGANTLLNYGYTILRAATSRAVVSCGLLPSLSIHHSAKQNPMALVDDLMEPFRPIVDTVVRNLVAIGIDYMCTDSKRELSSILFMDLHTQDGLTTLPCALQKLCYSLLLCLENKNASLSCPIVDFSNSSFFPNERRLESRDLDENSEDSFEL